MKYFTLCFLLLISVVFASAQKLPTVQKVSLRAPVDLKIDGRNSEWGEMKAYNRATTISYTLSNDDVNLYLVMQVKDIDALYKITNVGARITVIPDNLIKDKKEVVINYPFFEMGNKPYLDLKNAPASSITALDSFVVDINSRIDKSAKYIKINGVPGLDSILSVYNEAGIKARSAFDNKMVYTCEIAIPLKYLGAGAEALNKFKFHIMLRGTTLKDFGVTIQTDVNGTPVISANSGAAFPSKEHLAATTSTTDFWGEYTLAKKP